MKRRKIDPEVLRATRNRGLDETQGRIGDPERRVPLHANEQDGSAPERPTTPDETAAQDIAHLENPPQAEGPREQNNNAV